MAIYRLTPTEHVHIRWPRRVEVRAPNERRARLVASSKLGFMTGNGRLWIEPENVTYEEVSDSPFPRTGEVTVLTPKLTRH